MKIRLTQKGLQRLDEIKIPRYQHQDPDKNLEMEVLLWHSNYDDAELNTDAEVIALGEITNRSRYDVKEKLSELLKAKYLEEY